MPSVEKVDVAVVGAGILGASVAHCLAVAGAKPLVLEAVRPGSGATLNSFAWVNAIGKRPRAYFDLNREGMEEHRRLHAELGGNWYHSGGNLEWEAGDAARLAGRVVQLEEWGYSVRWLERPELAELVPELAVSDDVERAAFYPDDAFIDAVPLVTRLLAANPGVRLWTRARLASVEARGETPVGLVLTDGRRVAADRVVLCAGPGSAEVARSFGFELPMRASRGLIALSEPAPLLLDRVLHAPGVAIRPDAGGRLMIQSEALDRELDVNRGGVTIPTALETLLGRAVDVLPTLDGTGVEHHRIGDRALTADGLPAIGPLPESPGVYLAVTHSGVTLAPLIGRWVADEILREAEAPQLASYRPHRFAAGAAEARI